MRNKIRNVICTLVVLCLMIGLLPRTVFAAGTDRSIQLGTAGISSSTANEKNYIYYGMNGTSPIKWRVLDASKANDGATSGMFLMSEYLLTGETIHLI